MATETLSRDALAEIAEHMARDIAERGCFTHVIVSGAVFSNYTSLIRFLRFATAQQVEEAQTQLNAMEDQALAAERRQREQEQREADEIAKHAPLSAEEQAEVDKMNEEVRQVAEKANSLEGRLARIEDVLGRIAKGLEQQR